MRRFENGLQGGPWRYQCYSALKGEFWYDEFVRDLLSGSCKAAGCYRVKILPIFDMTLSRPNSHHGSMGRGVSDGKVPHLPSQIFTEYLMRQHTAASAL